MYLSCNIYNRSRKRRLRYINKCEYYMLTEANIIFKVNT